MRAKKILPGATQEEEKRLAPFVKALENAERAGNVNVPASTRAQRAVRSEVHKMVASAPAIEQAQRALDEQVRVLLEERRALLPTDARDPHVLPAEGYGHDRYQVVCESAAGRVALGGCADLGSAQMRSRWFVDELKRPTQ